jgi:hypothetical protein
LPVVQRFGHKNGETTVQPARSGADASSGIAPYSGLVPVTSNSRVLDTETMNKDPAYLKVQERCARIGALCQAFGVMRIDARRREGSEGDFVIFDVNSKPVRAYGSP